jgi:uncharacterized protein
VDWLWITLGTLLTLVIFLALAHFHIVYHFVPIVTRIFQEKPPFLLPFGKPVPGAEDIVLTTTDGLQLQACYLRTTKPRKGVILFGLEFGSNRWGCVPYCEFLRDAGYDIFAFEMRGQGQSPVQSGYEPLHWVTDFELIDFRTALEYLKTRPDKDPRGIGLLGLSKGGSAGLMIAANDEFVRCFVVDGIFAVMSTMVPYMMHWVFIYSKLPWVAKRIPEWYYCILSRIALRRVEKERKCHYPSLEACMPHLAPRPLLMIHGGADTYIKPDMARALFELAREPKALWLVEKAKHNQALQLVTNEYKKRVLDFFDKHLAGIVPSALNGAAHKDASKDQANFRP